MRESKTFVPEIVTANKCLLGEGPVWDATRKAICWVDILNGLIHDFSTEQQFHITIKVDQMVGAVALCTNGHFIAALQNGFAFIDRLNGNISMIADPENHLPNNRFNDGKCDPSGRFWAGTMSLSEEPAAGSLYMLHQDLNPVKKISDVSISNGMAWTADHKTLYYIDSPSKEIVSYDFDNNSGEISNRKVIIQFNSSDGFPDGMTIDTEGMLWVALWDGWQVSRWNPFTGEKLLSVEMPVARITSCTFGGDDLGDLYITTAKVGLTEEQLEQQPLAGSLFVIRNTGFYGLPAFEFISKE